MNEMIIVMTSTNNNEQPFTKLIRVAFDSYANMVSALGAVTTEPGVTIAEELEARA